MRITFFKMFCINNFIYKTHHRYILYSFSLLAWKGSAQKDVKKWKSFMRWRIIIELFLGAKSWWISIILILYITVIISFLQLKCIIYIVLCLYSTNLFLCRKKMEPNIFPKIVHLWCSPEIDSLDWWIHHLHQTKIHIWTGWAMIQK
jgi:hypothetical protein